MNIRADLEKCKFAEWEVEWLGFYLLQTSMIPVTSNVQGITDRLKPKKLKEVRSFLSAVNQMSRFIPNLAELFIPFRRLLKLRKLGIGMLNTIRFLSTSIIASNL